MAIKICKNGHRFQKASDCPVCPTCSAEEMNNKFGEEFPSIGATAFRALDRIGITTLRDVTKFNEKELLALHGFGPKALRLIHEAFNEKGLMFTKT